MPSFNIFFSISLTRPVGENLELKQLFTTTRSFGLYPLLLLLYIYYTDVHKETQHFVFLLYSQ